MLFGLQSLAVDIYHNNIKLHIDNTTTVAIIRHMGTSHNDNLNEYTKKIWLWAKEHDVWLFPVYVNTSANLADKASRKIYMDAE